MILFSRLVGSASISLGTVVGALFDMSNGIHPINGLALVCGAFASVCIGYYHLKKK